MSLQDKSRKKLFYAFQTWVHFKEEEQISEKNISEKKSHTDYKMTRWQFNTSTELRPLPSSDVFTDADMSVAAYIPMVGNMHLLLTDGT